MLGFLRWLGRNLGNLLLAFVLALVVWVSAIVAADPNEETAYPRTIPLEIVGQDPGLLQLNTIPTQVRLTINAPRSIWEQLVGNQDLLRAWVDLSGLEKGEHTLDVRAQLMVAPAQIIKIDPEAVQVKLEPLKTKDFPVTVTVSGEPALGYREGNLSVEPGQVTVSGPESLVDQIVTIGGSMDMNGANANIRRSILVQPLDSAGNPVEGVDISPETITASLPVTLLGGYRNVVVKVVTSGEPADGYWLTNISLTPPNVTVFSTDPQLVNALPGYVETNPIVLTGLSDDVDVRASLELPNGVTQVGEESVLVRLSIAAREGTLLINLPIEAIGLPPDIHAVFSPETVEVLLAGPLPILNNLKPAEIRVSVDLSEMEPGVYQVEPVVDLLPNQVDATYISPGSVQVTILPSPTATPTPTSLTTTPGIPSPTAAATLTPSPSPSLTPTP